MELIAKIILMYILIDACILSELWVIKNKAESEENKNA